MERRLLLDVVVSERAAVLKLLARKMRRCNPADTLLVLDLLLHVLDRVAGFNVQCDGLAVGLAKICMSEEQELAPGSELKVCDAADSPRDVSTDPTAFNSSTLVKHTW